MGVKRKEVRALRNAIQKELLKIANTEDQAIIDAANVRINGLRQQLVYLDDRAVRSGINWNELTPPPTKEPEEARDKRSIEELEEAVRKARDYIQKAQNPAQVFERAEAMRKVKRILDYKKRAAQGDPQQNGLRKA